MVRGLLCVFATLAATNARLDYRNFTPTTEKPFPAGRSQWQLCAFSPSELQLGPHDKTAVRMFVNDQARVGLADRRKQFPVGAAIVKEKWLGGKTTKLVAYAAMIKQKSGYDSKHGNWEYVYHDLTGEGPAERGKISSCIDCHQQATKGDFVFGIDVELPSKAATARAKSK
jgi:hypothetical protein